MECSEGLRTRLPAPMIKSEASIWSVLKSTVGKDLSRITIPVQFCEPLSFLQRISENLEYSYLLDNIDTNDPALRLQSVAAFAVSSLASNWNRMSKPFNPYLGETYELQRNGYRFFASQVKHHPPISAFYSYSENFVFHGWIQPKLKLWGKSVEIHPKGIMKVYLKKYNENYTWKNVDCTVHNLIVGKLWIEHHGSMEVQCPESGLKITLNFKPAGWFSNELHRVEGFIVDEKKTKHRFLYGKWTEIMRSTDIHSYEEYAKNNAHKFKLLDPGGGSDLKKSPATSPSPSKRVLQKFNSLSIRNFSTSIDNDNENNGCGSEGSQDAESLPQSGKSASEGDSLIDIPNSSTLWESRPRPEFSTDYYNFTFMAMTLNESPGKDLCPTDSRFRPDIRKLEEGDMEGAAEEKQRIEEKQRKFLKKNPEEMISPPWFEKSGENDWSFTGTYWNLEERQKLLKSIALF